MKSIPEAILIFSLLVIIAIMAVFAYDLFATKGTTISFKRVEKRDLTPIREKVEEPFKIYTGLELWKKKVKIDYEPPQSDLDKLIKQNQEVLVKNPNDIEALYALGVLYFMLERHSQANRFFQRVLVNDKSNESAKLAQVYLYYYVGEKKKAIQLLEKYSQEDPNNINYLNCQGVLYSLMGDKKAAKDYFSMAIQKQPTNKFAKESLLVLSK